MPSKSLEHGHNETSQKSRSLQSDLEERDLAEYADASRNALINFGSAASPIDPNSLTPQAILQLQRTVGNQAVQQLLQRDDTIAESDAEAEASAEPDVLDEELDRILEEAGFSADAPQAPTFEAITSTTAGEFSRGELESEIQRLWRREHLTFTEAARTAAQENTIGDRGPRAAQSPDMPAAVPYGQRWSVNLFAADYQQWSDLPDIARLMRQGSPFNRALAEEFDNVIPVRNPTTSQMGDAIFNAILGLSAAMNEGELGELIVTFSGHGGNGAISGVDGESLEVSDLRSYARVAQDFNIHMVYILDTCRAGILANFAQAEAMGEIAEGIDDLPEGQQQGAQQSFDVMRTMGRHIAQISGFSIFVGDTQRAFRRQRTTANFQALFERLTQLGERVVRSQQFLDSDAAAGIPNLEQLREQHMDLRWALIAAMDGNRGAGNRALRASAVLLDSMGDALNNMITQSQTGTPQTTE